jgi:hypothetical protein
MTASYPLGSLEAIELHSGVRGDTDHISAIALQEKLRLHGRKIKLPKGRTLKKPSQPSSTTIFRKP